jgi:hypothetical protein
MGTSIYQVLPQKCSRAAGIIDDISQSCDGFYYKPDFAVWNSSRQTEGVDNCVS